MTNGAYACLKLIQAASNNKREFAELTALFEVASEKSLLLKDGTIYPLLAKICRRVQDGDAILSKLEGKTEEEIKALDIIDILYDE